MEQHFSSYTIARDGVKRNFLKKGGETYEMVQSWR